MAYCQFCLTGTNPAATAKIMGKNPKKAHNIYTCWGAELAEKVLISSAYVPPYSGMQLKNTCVRLFRRHHETKK
jgi:hypothetical protein